MSNHYGEVKDAVGRTLVVQDSAIPGHVLIATGDLSMQVRLDAGSAERLMRLLAQFLAQVEEQR